MELFPLELLLFPVNDYVDSQSDVVVAGVEDPVLNELRAFEVEVMTLVLWTVFKL